MKFRTVRAMLALTATASACAEGGVSIGGGFTVTDSAGITIVEAADGTPTDTLALEQALVIGREGDADYEFHQIRTVLGLASGNLVVANGGTSQLKFYAPDGTFLRSEGQRGDGPGEFGVVTNAFLQAGDTLLVKDQRRRRFLRFDSAGSFVSAEPFEVDPSLGRPERVTDLCLAPSVVSLLDSGGRLVNGWSCLELERADGLRDWPIGLWVEQGGTALPLGDFSTMTVWERGEFQRPQRPWTPVPLSGAVQYATHEDRVYVSAGDGYQVDVFDDAGAQTTIIREQAEPPPVTLADRSRYEAAQDAAGAPHPSDVPFPERLAGYDQMVLSHEGDVWAGRRPHPGDAYRHWVVYDLEGRRVRRLALPAGVQLRSVRSGRVLGVMTDALGIQAVVGMDVER